MEVIFKGHAINNLTEVEKENYSFKVITKQEQKWGEKIQDSERSEGSMLCHRKYVEMDGTEWFGLEGTSKIIQFQP